MSNIDDFMRRFGEYLAKADESKKRGNNDYNPLKAVQNPYNEVNMHSGFIYSLLDTNGEHYQDDLFLSLFLEVLGLKEWFGSTTNAQVKKESDYIDLYIFNDTKHIIIENKINAGDQPNQIATFIETIHSNGAENKSVEYENIFVIFLTLHDREPSRNSRTNKDSNLLWEIKGEFLESKDGKIGYKKVLYENEILEWIESCQSKSGVGNIANLNYALESYKDIVQIITGKKESTMNIADFFKDSKDFEVAFEILNNINKIADKYLEQQVADNIRELLKNNKEEWVVSVEQKNNTQKAIVIAEDKFMNDKKPFFYFCIFWYRQSRFYCNIYLETFNVPINDKIKNIVSTIYADILEKKHFDLEGIKCIEKDFSKDKDFWNSHIINADKIAFNFINNEAKKIRQLNEKIRELYL